MPTEILNEKGQVVQIVDRDPKALKIFFLLFFVLFPVGGIVWFWLDGHGRIGREAAGYVQTQVLPEMKTWEEGRWLELATPDLADRLRQGQLQELARLGTLQSNTPPQGDQTRAREIEDQGRIFARVTFNASFPNGPRQIQLTVTRSSLETDWYVDEIIVTSPEQT